MPSLQFHYIRKYAGIVVGVGIIYTEVDLKVYKSESSKAKQVYYPLAQDCRSDLY
jgi:hypothetical protein